MGGSSGQRSTSATRRRRRRQCSVENGEETTIHGLSSVLIWILATSSVIVVISPSTSDESVFPPLTSYSKYSMDSTPLADKMYQSSNNHNYQEMEQQHQFPGMQQPPANQFYFPNFNRPMGLRWRDDSRMMKHPVPSPGLQNAVPMMPILTEHRSASPFGRGASTSNHRPTTSYGYDSPSLEDIDLIDVLWRGDIAAEKGTRQVAPADQYECDLQTLTEKSTVAPLTAEENARYEDLSKGYYQDFYPAFNTNPYYHKHNQQSHQQDENLKSPIPEQKHHEEQRELPTDKDLAELLDDVSREEGQLNLLFEDKGPVLNDVSLSDGIVYNQANLTEMQEMHDSCIQLSPTSSSQPDSLFNMTDAQTVQQWIQPTEMSPIDVFPQSNYTYVGMQNDTMQAIVSNGQIDYDHAYQAPNQPLTPLVIGASSATSSSARGRQQQTQTSPTSSHNIASLFDPYSSSSIPRNSFSDCTTDSSTPCSRLSSESPRYNSESSSASSGAMHESRFYGKLAPSRASLFDRPISRSSAASSSVSIKINRVVPLGSGQRKRGRQSKDEQLALEANLPVSASEISEMSLSEMQSVLKDETLSEDQRVLMRRIRRRGKNKVAARTCRQRRTDRHHKTGQRHFL